MAILAASLLAGCAAAPSSVEFQPRGALLLDSELFEPRPEVISIAEIHALAPGQVTDFLRYFDAPQNASMLPHERVFEYLDNITSEFDYLGETLTARQALEQSSGNCLSLAILTTALANIADVEVGYQLVDSLPVFEGHGDVVFRGKHVRSMLYDPTWIAPKDFVVLERPGINVDYYPNDFDRFVGNIERSEYFAMYFQNVAAEALLDDRLGDAYWLLRESLTYSAENPDTLNTLAIVYARAGDLASSENIYRHALANADESASLLRNYGVFLRRQGRLEEAQQIEARLARLNDQNPFDWFSAGQDAFDDGDFKQAIRLFERGIELAPYLHEGFFGLAKSYLQLGDRRMAAQHLEHAMELANRSSTRELYAAKIDALAARDR